MLKKILYTLYFSTISLFSLESGDMLPSSLGDKLVLEKDKIYIIDFFASWCKSCEKELPLMMNLNTKIDANRVEIIGVDVDEDISKGKAFQESLKLNFKVIDDSKNELIKIFDPVGMPAIFIVKNSKIIATVIGAKDDIDSYILEVLKDLKWGLSIWQWWYFS